MADDTFVTKEGLQHYTEKVKEKLKNKIDALGNEPVSGQPYHIPFNINPIVQEKYKISTTFDTITLDGNKTKTTYPIEIPSADVANDKAGLYTKELADAKISKLPKAFGDKDYEFPYNIFPPVQNKDSITATFQTVELNDTTNKYDRTISLPAADVDNDKAGLYTKALADKKSKVSVSATGTATTSASYITIDGVESKIGGSSDMPVIDLGELSSDVLTQKYSVSKETLTESELQLIADHKCMFKFSFGAGANKKYAYLDDYMTTSGGGNINFSVCLTVPGTTSTISTFTFNLTANTDDGIYGSGKKFDDSRKVVDLGQAISDPGTTGEAYYLENKTLSETNFFAIFNREVAISFITSGSIGQVFTVVDDYSIEESTSPEDGFGISFLCSLPRPTSTDKRDPYKVKGTMVHDADEDRYIIMWDGYPIASSSVSVSTTGTATDGIKYITIDGTEHSISGNDSTKVAKIGDTMTGNLLIKKDNPQLTLETNDDAQSTDLIFMNSTGTNIASVSKTPGGVASFNNSINGSTLPNGNLVNLNNNGSVTIRSRTPDATVKFDFEITNNGKLKWRDKDVITGYLGGECYAPISFENEVSICKTNSKGILRILGHSDGGNGSSLILSGIQSSDGGSFTLRANDASANYALLIGKPTGELTWNNSDVITAAGGTMTGTIITSVDQALVKNNDSGALAIQGGSADSKGARLSLSGKDRSGGYAGMFTLRAYDGTNDKTLTGKPDGTLTWGSNDISGTPVSYNISAGSGTNISIYRKYCYKIGRMVFVSISGKNNSEIAEYATSVPVFTGLPAPIARWDLGVHYFDRNTVRGTRFQLDTNGRIMSDSEGFEANFFSFNFTYISAS